MTELKKPKVSCVIPIHDMPNSAFFLKRLQDSLDRQTFRDFEVVMTKEGKMAENTNAAIKRAKGELIKILFMDDYFAHERALQEIVDAFSGNWLVTACGHDYGDGVWTRPHHPKWNDKILEGINTIGSPSVLTMKNEDPLLFDEKMSWLLDCELYWRMYNKYGPPKILNDINVIIGVGDHQTTHLLTDEEKLAERNYLMSKYG